MPSVLAGLRIKRGLAGRVVFPPEQDAEVKAIACELPRTHELPLSRFSRAELHRLVIERGVTEASASTIWRWLHEDAIKPWQTRSWIFPRDPDFATKAGRVLDLYARTFEGRRLRPDEYVISADEKTQPQALGRGGVTANLGRTRVQLSSVVGSLSLSLRAAGHSDRLLPVSRARLAAHANRVVCERRNVAECYAAGRSGSSRIHRLSPALGHWSADPCDACPGLRAGASVRARWHCALGA